MNAPVLVAGIDEAGRGPLAGPVVAAAVILGAEIPIGLADSKRLAPGTRERLLTALERSAFAIGIGIAEVAEIDRLNILAATLLAMQRAVAALGVVPAHALVDGNRCPALPCAARAVVRGDATVPAISAASIVAKVTRDRMMDRLSARYPEYGFARHKGYPTPAHLAALARHGISPVHRLSFAPVRRVRDAAG